MLADMIGDRASDPAPYHSTTIRKQSPVEMSFVAPEQLSGLDSGSRRLRQLDGVRAMVYYATCHTPDNNDYDRRIQGLGGHTWRFNIDRIIYMIDIQGYTFRTSPPSGAGQEIITATHPRSNRRYLRTVSDGVEPNNILSLPRCP